MPPLEQVQRAMMHAIAGGPEQVPGDLFAGGRDSALRGLSVHANTITHARLVALEDTFPHTRAVLGDAAFNALSRGYVDGGGIGRQPLALIGRSFPDWLADHADFGTAAEIARFEWTWLQCYHAAEAPAFGMGELASLGEAAIAELVLGCHPASAVLPLGKAAWALLGGDVAASSGDAHVLIARPDADVRAVPVSIGAARLHAALSTPLPICNLLAESAEPGLQDALLALIAQGALVRIMEDAC